MNAELKTKWIEALRSGSYDQGIGVLVAEDCGSGTYRYCCLGVLAVCADVDRDALFMKDHLTSIGRDDLLGAWGQGDTYDSEAEETLTTDQRRLAAMNDNGKSFAQIAEWIEANVGVDHE